MSRQYASQLRLEINPSRTYRTILWVLSSVALLSIFIVDINSVFLKFIITSVLVIYVVYTLSNNRQRILHWQADSYWLIEQQKQVLDHIFRISPQVKAKLLSGSVVTTFLSVLNFRSVEGKRFSVVFFKDSLSELEYRRLRLKLKLEGVEVSSHDTL